MFDVIYVYISIGIKTQRDVLQELLKETRLYWELKEEALDCTLWRTGFGRGYGPVVGETMEYMNECMNE